MSQTAAHGGLVSGTLPDVHIPAVFRKLVKAMDINKIRSETTGGTTAEGFKCAQ